MFDVFVENPERVMIVASAFLIAFVRFRDWSLLVATVLWWLYALLEWSIQGTGMNIRVDLLFIYPVLFVVSVVAILLSILNSGKNPPE